MDERHANHIAQETLSRVMSDRDLAFTTISERKLSRYNHEKLLALAQILVREGPYAFCGECEVSGLVVVRVSVHSR